MSSNLALLRLQGLSRSTFHDHDDQTAKPRKGKRPGWLSGWQARHLGGLTIDNLTIVTVQGLALSRAGPLDLLTANRSNGVAQKEHKRRQPGRNEHGA